MTNSNTLKPAHDVGKNFELKEKDVRDTTQNDTPYHGAGT